MEILPTRCVIGIPISANNMYAPTKKGGLAKTRKYKAWIEHNEPILVASLKPAERFPIQVHITVVEGRGWQQSRDIDNVIKPIIDLLVRSKVVPDDRSEFIRDVKATFMPFWGTKSEAIPQIYYEEPDDDEDASEWGVPQVEESPTL